MAWSRSRTAMPTVVALRQRFEAIRRAELDRLQPKIAGLPPEARARVDEITRLIIEKLLITPTEQLKALPDQELLQLVRGRPQPPVRARRSRRRRGRRRAGPAAGRQRAAGVRRVVSALGQTPPDRHARQHARAVAGAGSGAPARGDRRGHRDRRHPHVGRSRQRGGARRRAADRWRRQAPVRQGNRGRAARRVDSISRCTAPRICRWCCRPSWSWRRSCRGRRRGTRWCCRRRHAGVPRTLDAVLGRPRSDAAASAPAASGASRSSTGCCRARPSSPSAATSTRGCGSSTRDATTPSCWRAPAWSGSAPAIASRWRCR